MEPYISTTFTLSNAEGLRLGSYVWVIENLDDYEIVYFSGKQPSHMFVYTNNYTVLAVQLEHVAPASIDAEDATLTVLANTSHINVLSEFSDAWGRRLGGKCN